MKVNRELIEKYHRQECSPEEAEAVEEWLFADDSEENLLLPLGENKLIHKQDIWAGIEPVLPKDETPYAPLSKNKTFNRAFWLGAIAATVLLLVGFFAFNFGTGKGSDRLQLLSVDNKSPDNVKFVRSVGYNLEVGPNTSAQINNLKGVIYFSGSIMIRPEKDVELSFAAGGQKMLFKAGQTYIILHDKQGNGKIVIVNEKNLMDIPPVLQKKIATQFNI